MWVFLHMPLPTHAKLYPKFLSSHPGQREASHFPRKHFFRNLFPSTPERCGENYDLVYQNSIRKDENDLEH